RGRGIVQLDQGKWDYRHQVLAQKYLRPWQLFLAVKWLEIRFHVTPHWLWSMLRRGTRMHGRQRRWVFRHIAVVWLAEVVEFLLGTSFARSAASLTEREGARGPTGSS